MKPKGSTVVGILWIVAVVDLDEKILAEKLTILLPRYIQNDRISGAAQEAAL